MSDPHTALAQSTTLLYLLCALVSVFVLVQLAVLRPVTVAGRWAGVQALAVCLWLLVSVLPPRVEPVGGAA